MGNLGKTIAKDKDKAWSRVTLNGEHILIA
jgi:hypothetical protein